jgi:ribonuclease E
LSPFAVPGADQPELLPVYAGPTPADPFGGRAFDIFDVMDQAERAAEAKPAPRAEIVGNTEPEPEPADELAAAAPAASHNGQAPHPAAESAGSAAAEPTGEARGAEPSPPTSEIVAEIAIPGPTPAEPAPAEPASAEPAPAEPAPAEPLIRPIMVGAGGEVPAEKKRGWWRR